MTILRVGFLQLIQFVNILPLPIDPVKPQPRVPPPFDFSKATKLKDLEFKLYTPNIQWVTKTLLTVKNIRHIKIQSQRFFSDSMVASVRHEWRDLDRLLVQLWISRSIRPEITFMCWGVNLGRTLLPELAKKGVFDDYRPYG